MASPEGSTQPYAAPVAMLAHRAYLNAMTIVSVIQEPFLIVTTNADCLRVEQNGRWSSLERSGCGHVMRRLLPRRVTIPLLDGTAGGWKGWKVQGHEKVYVRSVERVSGWTSAVRGKERPRHSVCRAAEHLAEGCVLLLAEAVT